MDITSLTTVVGLLVTLSIASERLVEIVKGLITPLNHEWIPARNEGWRRALIQIMAVVAGMITVGLALPVVHSVLGDKVVGVPEWTVIVGLGLLASGGSGFWNTILAYLLQVKDIKAVEADAKKQEKKEKELERSALPAPKLPDGN